ncbi:MAG: S-layer protein domain-containing protein, partial [Euryarchaeota archaeon]|nr:S-layer protein domain-containing protein [Euryarchaeota archaeon]
MKRFTALTMAALMVFAVFAGVASAGDTVEIRSSVTDSAAKTWDANGFAGFWLDLDTGEFSENLTLTVTGGDTILEDTGVVYEAVPVEDQDPEYEFTVDATTSNPYNYSKIGFLAEEYFVVADDVATLSKILMDDDSSYTMRTGESLELGEGYALSPQQIDVDGNKVWLELTKDGEFVDDKIISTDVDEEYKKTWYYQMDLNDNDDVDVIMIHIDEVFQGQVDSLCVIDGIFQISDDPLVLEEDDEFNELTITGLGSTIVLTNDDNELDMPDDDTLALTETIGIRASEDTDRWYIYTEKTEPGTYEIRSSVTDSAAKTWDANGFAGFWLDLDTGEFSENLTLTVTGG